MLSAGCWVLCAVVLGAAVPGAVAGAVPSAVPNAVPSAAQPPADELKQKFAHRAEEIATRLDGVMAYTIVDLESGDRFAHLDTSTLPTASTIKLALVYELFKQVEEGRVRLEDTLVLNRAKAVGGTGVLADLGTPTLSICDYAVLMVRLSELAAPYFDSVEVIEAHHDGKIDSPSGTAIYTAERIAAASSDWGADPTKKENIANARGAVGAGGVHVHSLRVRGMVASQEVVFGTTGQSLTVRHDTYDRSSFMPGVLIAVKRIADHPGVTVGLDHYLGL